MGYVFYRHGRSMLMFFVFYFIFSILKCFEFGYQSRKVRRPRSSARLRRHTWFRYAAFTKQKRALSVMGFWQPKWIIPLRDWRSAALTRTSSPGAGQEDRPARWPFRRTSAGQVACVKCEPSLPCGTGSGTRLCVGLGKYNDSV